MATIKQAAAQQTLTYPYMGNLEDYQDRNKIGEGTSGIVYKGQCKKTNKFVALKQIKINKEDEGFPSTAINEINIQDLTHENIVKFIGMCHSPKINPCRSEFYLIFEFCDYELNSIIQNIQLTIEPIKCIMNQILTGLYYLHNNEIVHRDLKPANILITKDGILKIADFGLSKEMRSTENNQQNNHKTDQYVTLYYRAPELLLGDQNYDKAIDLWSVGCIFAELYTRIPIMRGKEEVHQIGLIRALRGEIEWPGIRDLKSYDRLRLCQIENPQVQKYIIDYEKHIKSSFAIDSNNTINFINKFLTLDPKKRINVERALKSNFFEHTPNSEVLKLFLSHNSKMQNQQRQKMLNLPRKEVY